LLDKVPNYELSISALSGRGLDKLSDWLDKKVSSFNQSREFVLKPENGAAIAWLYAHGFVEERQDFEDKIVLKVNIADKDAVRFAKLFLSAAKS
jgi:GTP-binding protein HflX